jgi:glutamate-1-semialdehyde 2,1-aminomutase
MANMGVIPPKPGYLEGLRELTQQNGILLILDETVTGFRISGGGCQVHYGLEPDLSTFGKALGGGVPVAALVGRAEVMEALSWGGVLHYGTQNASRIGLHVARATLLELNRYDGAAFRDTWELGERLCQELTRVFEETGTEAIVQGVGPMFQILFTDQPFISDYRSFCAYVDRTRYQQFVRHLFDQGIYMTPSAVLHSVVTQAHTLEHLDQTVSAVREACQDDR